MPRHLAAATLVVALAAPAIAAQASESPADYPSHPIRLLLPISAGSGGDILGRVLAQRMSAILKQTIVVENKGGASGIIGTQAVARAAPDGYTFTLGGATTHMLNAAVYTKLPYDPVKDFTAIGQVGTAAILLVASNDFPANDIKELVAYTRSHPNEVQYASWGTGSTGQFCGEVLKQLAGASMTHIPYKTVPQVLNDIVAGHIKLGYVDMTSGTPFVKSGKVKAIGTCTSRSPSLPGVKSYVDEGIDFDRVFRWGLYVPAGTPRPIVQKLSDALNQVLATPEIKASLLEMGIAATPMSGEELGKLNARDIPAWKEVAKAAGVTQD
ncbi:Bug family tripartite tricarboxylate transporter substrate binding protein [Cupriavidus basilensis]|uniref:Bug family tripartite tricarboxylate transporter substrate binding protein n=1 Tax=Cupriavidus basilensis TaxID=68895 RepID=UPI00157B26E6|nr:tripartite tricarboxylate transporter substrate binding protein [Cupriavidus basilensis]NUA30861.1 tripartite tricarboxylate transporter substrate binding protein [Cupriavidus basilensis]